MSLDCPHGRSPSYYQACSSPYRLILDLGTAGDSLHAIMLLSSAAIVLVGVLGYEALYVPCGVIPSAFFKDRTIGKPTPYSHSYAPNLPFTLYLPAGIVMAATFFQTFCYTAITYYLALYYQVRPIQKTRRRF